VTIPCGTTSVDLVPADDRKGGRQGLTRVHGKLVFVCQLRSLLGVKIPARGRGQVGDVLWREEGRERGREGRREREKAR